MIFNISFQLVLKKEEYIENNNILRIYDSLVLTEPYIKVGEAIVSTKNENNLYKSKWCINLYSNDNKYIYTFNTETENDIIHTNKGICKSELEIVDKDNVLYKNIDFMVKQYLNIYYEVNCLSTNIYVNINNENNETEIKNNKCTEKDVYVEIKKENEQKDIQKECIKDVLNNDTQIHSDIKTEKKNEDKKENMINKFDLTILEERILYDIMKRIEQ